MSVLSNTQQEQVLDILFKQKSILADPTKNTNHVEVRLLAERLHLVLNADVALPLADDVLVKAWYNFDSFTLPFYVVSGSNLGGLPDGTVVEPNGHLMEVKTVDNKQILQAICEHDYMAQND